jgi:hypothetical protein
VPEKLIHCLTKAASIIYQWPISYGYSALTKLLGWTRCLCVAIMVILLLVGTP